MFEGTDDIYWTRWDFYLIKCLYTIAFSIRASLWMPCWLVPRSDLADHLTLLTRRAVCQWVSSWNLFGMIVKHGHLNTYIESVQAKVKYPCNLCEHKAITQGILKNHNESVHENVQYTCKLCEYKAKQQGHLNTHIELVHEKVKYLCTHCQK